MLLGLGAALLGSTAGVAVSVLAAGNTGAPPDAWVPHPLTATTAAVKRPNPRRLNRTRRTPFHRNAPGAPRDTTIAR